MGEAKVMPKSAECRGQTRAKPRSSQRAQSAVARQGQSQGQAKEHRVQGPDKGKAKVKLKSSVLGPDILLVMAKGRVKAKSRPHEVYESNM
jgi:hypothetical protein